MTVLSLSSFSPFSRFTRMIQFVWEGSMNSHFDHFPVSHLLQIFCGWRGLWINKQEKKDLLNLPSSNNDNPWKRQNDRQSRHYIGSHCEYWCFRWLMMGIIGFSVGIVGFLLHQIIDIISEFKWELTSYYIQAILKIYISRVNNEFIRNHEN